jgi:hypothetical protein
MSDPDDPPGQPVGGAYQGPTWPGTNLESPWFDALSDLARLTAEIGRVQAKFTSNLRSLEIQPPTEPRRSDSEIGPTLERLEFKIDRLADSLVPRASTIVGRLDELGIAPIELESRQGQLGSESQRPGCAPGGQGTGGHEDRWGRAILGHELWESPGIEADRSRLLDGFLGGEPEACSLAAQLILVRYTPAERMLQLIKELGEAYYRWQPKLTEQAMPFESALAAWLTRSGEASGLRNRIELVCPGTRYNPQQHRSSDRGVEVTQALGWIVLREDGSVYQKANVAVK